MNKNLLAIAVSAAILAPAVASADVKVYGIVQAEYNIEDCDGYNEGQDVACGGSVQGVDDNAGRSRIGFKFSEKLGGGLTAFGKVEFRIDPADNSSNGTNKNATSVSGALGQRDVHAGIKGAWGALAAGSFHAPYKIAGGVKWDPWAATHLQARRAGGMTGGAGTAGHNGFMRNAIQYTSPKVNGFQASFAISPDETNHARTGNSDDGSDNDYSIALQYKNGPWHALVAHNRNNDNTTASGDQTLTKVGLRWKSGMHTVAGQYEWLNDGLDKGRGGQGQTTTPGLGLDYSVHAGEDADVYWLNYQYKMGNNILTASYGNTDIDGPGYDLDYDYWAVGVIHKFSKKTRVFGGYTETDGDWYEADRDAWTVGIRKDF